MRLKLAEWLEEQILDRVVDRAKVGRIKLVAANSFPEAI